VYNLVVIAVLAWFSKYVGQQRRVAVARSFTDEGRIPGEAAPVAFFRQLTIRARECIRGIHVPG
jgi:hypothetical protein